MKNHGNKQGKLDSVVKSSGSRYTEVISFRFLGSCKELRWAELCKSSLPPCLIGVVEGNPLSRGGHTQVAGFGAFSRHPLPLNQWTKTFFPGVDTHTEPFSARSK